ELHVFFASKRRHTRFERDWSSDVCSSDLDGRAGGQRREHGPGPRGLGPVRDDPAARRVAGGPAPGQEDQGDTGRETGGRRDGAPPLAGRKEDMRRKTTAALAAVAIALGACSTDADVASKNLSKAAEQFEIERRVVFLNGITDEYLLSIEG